MSITRLLSILCVFFSFANALVKEDNRMVAFLGNWQACPTAAQLDQYTHIMVSFAVSYTWSPSKNICSPTCEIATPPICNNAPNSNLINDLHAKGKKVVLSFGGAGMGGSWAGDVNDCWEYCFGRETQVVDRLVQIVNDLKMDGVDIDYEYFYENDQNGSGFTKGAQAINFLKQVTTGLRSKLPANALVTHAPMDADLVAGSDYLTMLQSVSSSIDFLMPQYYNGITRPARDGFFNAGVGTVATSAHYQNLVATLFNGQADRLVLGFCISDCAGTGSNTGAAAAKAVMDQVNTAYSCHGGAFFWVAAHDVNGQWSQTVNTALQVNRGCSARLPSPPTPVASPVQAPTPVAAPVKPPSPVAVPTPVAAPVKPPSPVAVPTPVATPVKPPSPVASPTSVACCPSGFTGLVPSSACTGFITCQNGVQIGGEVKCSTGLLFDGSKQVCNWTSQVTCVSNGCSQVPVAAPVKAPVPAPTPVVTPVKAPVPAPTPVATPVKAPVPAPTPVATPVKAPAPTPVATPVKAPVRRWRKWNA
ncbi:hypothetical protein FisN_20Lh160 [Fistulifera solaris]|uniref:Uncharacterized protein n=1 Tax=Fistulifera solaris TaxID=1519565 RepID=A0A1Z5KRB7_FISSO|nr:hypothetical protein FisN_20Lh160 [Fistulifera solaris]|eukprot:GAX28860.1 hypothetical protein FisN_20Lh160 [Fistulifera solaris]